LVLLVDHGDAGHELVVPGEDLEVEVSGVGHRDTAQS
jgi:hypothetical protein